MYWTLVLGVATGMRTFTPMSVFCWFMYFAVLPVSRLNFWTAYIAAPIVFSVLALGEYYGDTLASTPSRKSLGPLLARLVMGAGVGLLVFSSFGEPLVGGAIFGGVGALIGTYGGYALRMSVAKKVGKDLPVALSESALALVLSVVAMVQIHGDWVSRQTNAALHWPF
jgi:uncharacterized membrane protein